MYTNKSYNCYICVPPKFTRWNLTLMERPWMWGLSGMMRPWTQSPLEWDWRPHKREPRELPSLLPPCEDKEGKQPFMIKKKMLYYLDLNSARTVLLNFVVPELWEINFYCLQAPWFMAFYYNRPGLRKQPGWNWPIPRKTQNSETESRANRNFE